MDGRRALIVGAAPAPGGEAHYHRLIEDADLLIAADGGLLVCLEAGCTPDICVGDFDSTSAAALSQAAASGAEIRRYPAVKDVSDLDLALAVAREAGCTEVTFAAAFAGRLDHTLAALGTVVSAADLGGVCDEPEWRGFALRSELGGVRELSEPVGTIISVMAMGVDATVNATGFGYAMSRTVLSALSSHGLSNVATERTQRIEVVSGTVLVIVNRER
ncbi:MAG: thiamine diphosphokinase [Coriobacteriia bacterium]|nr:thiamine diphosphokinase [Coriobacteriia bacterium]